MQKDKRKTFGIVLFITLTALGIRLYPALTSSMPLNDGGLFYMMINDLLKNDFALPFFITYNGQIPFAYPPFAFYLGAFIVKFSGIQTIDLIRLLPPIISVFAIIAFWGLARRLIKSPVAGILAVLFFSFTPLAFEWQIMGGGITRSFGQTFAIMALCAIYDYYNHPNNTKLAALIAWSTLVVYTHPEAALQTALAAFWMWLYFDQTRKTFARSVLAVGLVAILSAPWWLTVLLRFHAQPFLAVFSAAGQDSLPFLSSIFLLFRFDFADEPFVSIASVLGLLGMFIAFAKRTLFLPVWLLLALILDMRSGARFAMIPLSMLAAITLDRTIIPIIRQVSLDEADQLGFEQKLLGNRWMKIFSGYLFISLAFGAFSTAFRIAETQTVLPAERQAMQWLADNTVPSATIVTVTGKLPLLDPVTEWMPALTGRYVATSAFGVEWVDGKRFSTILQSHRDLQACANRDDSCLQGWISDYGAYNYIYFSMGESDFPLRIDLLQEPDYQLVYVSKGVSIFKLVSLARRLSVQADSHIRYVNLSLGHP